MRAAGTGDGEKQVRACSAVRSCAVLSLILGVGYVGTCWWVAAQSVAGCDPMTARPSRFTHSLHGAVRTKPWKINSGWVSERVGGRGPRGHVGSVWGSPGRVALVMAASGPGGGLGQRQALPEVFQLCLELLPLHCQLLSLGHQLLERTGHKELEAPSTRNHTPTHTHTHILDFCGFNFTCFANKHSNEV